MAAADVRKPALAPPLPPGSNIRKLELSGLVGFKALPEQLVAKAKQKGFTFNLMCVGETGIGKTTLMESLFNMTLDLEPCSHELKTVELRSSTYDIEESGVRLKLTIVETAGFGDQLDKESSARVIMDYINKQFEAFLQEEMKIKRALQFYHDTRIHACIYFISPTGHGLKALDRDVLKQLAAKVNVIPVIAKADTISKDELDRFKAKILSDMKNNGIDYYMFPMDDETYVQVNSNLNANVPFAVVGSTDFVKKGNKNVRARQYPWGIVEVENEEHCDFVKLREALLRTNVEDLRERTHRVLYENYRRHRLQEMGLKEGDLGPGIQQAYQQRRAEHLATLQSSEKELREKFLQRVKAKEDELKRQEQELQAKAEAQKRQVTQELQEMDEDNRKLDLEIAEFNRLKAQYTQTLSRKKK